MKCPQCKKDTILDKFGSWICEECDLTELDYLRTKPDDSIFELYYSWLDDYEQVLFTGPYNISEEEFKEICKSIIPEAGRLAIAAKGDMWIGWREVIDSMVDLLREKGFHKFTPKHFMTPGSIIINREKMIQNAEYKEAVLLGDSLNLISEHNRKLEEDYREDMEEDGLDEEIPPKNS